MYSKLQSGFGACFEMLLQSLLLMFDTLTNLERVRFTNEFADLIDSNINRSDIKIKTTHQKLT